MKAGKLVAYIGAAILILFGILFIVASTDKAQGQAGWFWVGLIMLAVALVLVFFASKKPKPAPTTNITMDIDLPANVNMDTLKCRACGGTLGTKDIQMVAGAPVVTCPWCHTTYQLTEDPKW